MMTRAAYVSGFGQLYPRTPANNTCEIGMPSLSTRNLSMYSLSNDQASFMFLEMFVPDLVPQLGSSGLGGLQTTLYYVCWGPCTDLHGLMPFAAKILQL